MGNLMELSGNGRGYPKATSWKSKENHKEGGRGPGGPPQKQAKPPKTTNNKNKTITTTSNQQNLSVGGAPGEHHPKPPKPPKTPETTTKNHQNQKWRKSNGSQRKRQGVTPRTAGGLTETKGKW